MLTARGVEILLAFAGGLGVLWFWRAKYRPWMRCPKCRGRRRVGSSKRWRKKNCSRCNNTGEVLVWGARFFQGGGR